MTKKATKAPKAGEIPADATKEGRANDKAKVTGSPLPETEKAADNEVRGSTILHTSIPVDSSAEGRVADKSPVTDSPKKPNHLNHHADETGTPVTASQFEKDLASGKASAVKITPAVDDSVDDSEAQAEAAWQDKYFEGVAAAERTGKAI